MVRNGHWEGPEPCFSTNPEAHQWSQTFINSKMAAFEFAGDWRVFMTGAASFFSGDTLNGKSVLVRAVVVEDCAGTSHHFEELVLERWGQDVGSGFRGRS